MKKSRFLKWLRLSVYTVVSLIVLTVLGFYIYIRIHVNQYVELARKSIPDETEKVYAMVKYMNSSNYTLKERNNMIWAIGQLSDDRALPYLQKLYTGEPCKHSLNLCQYELAKAINKCEGMWKLSVEMINSQQIEFI